MQKFTKSILTNYAITLFQHPPGIAAQEVTFATACPIDDYQTGQWKSYLICGNSWDGVHIDTNVIAEHKYTVDWCGYWPQWSQPPSEQCATNCTGNCSSYGTIYQQPQGSIECRPEAVRAYRWVCNNCNTSYSAKIAECGGAQNIISWNNATCDGDCLVIDKPKNEGRPEDCNGNI